MSGELEHFQSVKFKEAEQLARAGGQAINLHLIFNRHVTAEEGAASTAGIEPHSVVCLESFPTSENLSGTMVAACDWLNDRRFEYGLASPEYTDFKQDVIDNLPTIAYADDDISAYPEHAKAIYESLLAKDCVIVHADHRYMTGESALGTIYADETNQKAKALFEQMMRFGLDFSEFDGGLGKSLKALPKRVIHPHLAHNLRESKAAFDVLLQGLDIEVFAKHNEVARDTDSRILTYMVYGTMHEKSLTWQFTSRGIQPAVTNLYPLPDYRYIDPITDPEYNNEGRRIGHACIETLIRLCEPKEDAAVLAEEAYHNLEFLNGEENKEERRAFVIGCAQALRARKDTPRDTIDQYLSIMRSFMPETSRFLPAEVWG
jgi:hypothetical protein